MTASPTTGSTTAPRTDVREVLEKLLADRVLVLDGGRVVEDGDPRQLLQTDSRFAAELAAQRGLVERLEDADGWRRLVLGDGRLVEGSYGGGDAR